ncbi:MAG: IS4 family transposase [Polyangiales bacterium]
MAAPFDTSKIPSRPRSHKLDPASIYEFVEDLIGDDLHAQRVWSVANGVLGVLHGATLAIHAIGEGLAVAMGLEPKHAIKQVDRLLSNRGVDVEVLAPLWVSFVLAERKDIVVAMDWTDFDGDAQTTLVLNVITTHGRATPLLWKTVAKKGLKTRRNDYEDDLLRRLRDAVPEDVRVTVLADRGFGDQKLYQYLRGELGFDYVIRFRGNIRVTSASGEARTAAEWLRPDGRLVELRGAGVTADDTSVERIVIVRAKGMKDAWYLASSRKDLTGAKIKDLYGRRFSIEENLRDTKDLHFGLGLSATHISVPARRDRLLLLVAMAEALLTLLGAAAESLGLDKKLKVNTVKKRTHSLFRQGSFWYRAIPTMKEERLRDLMTAFENTLAQHSIFRGIFGAI